MPTFAIKSRFDIASKQSEKYANRFDAVMPDRLTQCVSHCESGAKYNARNTHLFDAENITASNATPIHFASEGRGLCKISAVFDAVAIFEHPRAGVTGKFELTRSWDTGVKGRFEAIRPSFHQVSGQFDAVFYLKYAATAGMFDANSVFLKQIVNSFDVMPGYQNTVTVGRFDAFVGVLTAVPMSKQAFVKSGWRVLIRNTETNEKRDLGFIEADAVEKSIKDVDLPDGDYEITLLHSSLFWQNAVDRVVRNVTIRADEDPVLGLPPVLNLTSEVTDGVTRISWASNSGDYEDCEFGLWFGSVRTLHPGSFQPPLDRFALLRSSTPANSVSGLVATERQLHPAVVPHDREPDQTVTYTASDVEYGVNITQSVPLWCVVMAIKGNMRGPASEIYLNWEMTLPRRPDDQVAFDVFLDEKLEQLKNASGKVEGVEWDTSQGYW